MRINYISYMLILTAAVFTYGPNEAKSAFSAEIGVPNLNFRIGDYQPAPPGVYVQSDGGRPYYVERDRRIYIEKRKPGGHYKKEKKHHEDNRYEDCHDRHNRLEH